MASKKSILSNLGVGVQQERRPFELDDVQEEIPTDFSAEFGSRGLDEDEEDEDLPAPSSVLNQFKIPEPLDDEIEQPHPIEEVHFKIPEVNEEFEEKDEPDESEEAEVDQNDFFKIPEVEKVDEEEEIEEEEPSEAVFGTLPEEEEEEPPVKEEPIVEPPKPQIKKEISIKPEVKPEKVAPEPKMPPQTNGGTSMNETDKKILIKLLEQTQPNIAGLDFLGEDYLNSLWLQLKNYIM